MSLAKTVYHYLFAGKKNKIDQEILNNWESAGRPVPPPHLVKQLTISDIQKKSQYGLFIETGTYLGEMVEAQRANFRRVYSIELSPELFESARKKFLSDTRVTILQGDSSDVLPTLLGQINEPGIFWLDGHYSEG
ncbi:MAG TPA: hypothetical protein VHS53_04625, partial [Mucilaginibacter sp.]|nr:hypothetical protein [Mucilaginibacter sp.]